MNLSLSLRIIEFRIPRLEERGDLGPPNLGMEDRFELRPLLCGSSFCGLKSFVFQSADPLCHLCGCWAFLLGRSQLLSLSEALIRPKRD